MPGTQQELYKCLFLSPPLLYTSANPTPPLFKPVLLFKLRNLPQKIEAICCQFHFLPYWSHNLMTASSISYFILVSPFFLSRLRWTLDPIPSYLLQQTAPLSSPLFLIFNLSLPIYWFLSCCLHTSLPHSKNRCSLQHIIIIYVLFLPFSNYFKMSSTLNVSTSSPLNF